MATVAYVPYAMVQLNGPRGGTWPGLIFGAVGTLMILFCGLLGVRKRVPTWRLGNAGSWMRAHIWLGLLSAPMILFHGGFAMGGTLTQVLMWLLFIVVASGIHGLAVQQFLPRLLTNQVETETIYEQIPHVIEQLADEALQVIESVCGPLSPPSEPLAPPSPADAAAASRPPARPKAKPAAPKEAAPTSLAEKLLERRRKR